MMLEEIIDSIAVRGMRLLGCVLLLGVVRETLRAQPVWCVGVQTVAKYSLVYIYMAKKRPLCAHLRTSSVSKDVEKYFSVLLDLYGVISIEIPVAFQGSPRTEIRRSSLSASWMSS